MSDMKLVADQTGKLRLVIGKRGIKLEKIDDHLYRAFISAKSLMKRRFEDLPLYEKDGEEIIIEFMPYSRIKEEYVYERKGLSILDEATIWRNRERGYVYAEILIPAWDYAYKAWIPLDLYAWIIVETARKLGFEAEAHREEQTMLIEFEKSYPLDTPLRIPLLEIKELDAEIKKVLEKTRKKVSQAVIKTLTKLLDTDAREIEEVLSNPEDKLSTKP